MDSETFDKEFDLEAKSRIDELVKSIVEEAKADVRARYGNKKRHRQ